MRKSYFSGLAGEWQAASVLRRAGCRIVAKRYRAAGGEVDLIARKDGFVIFAEVKTGTAGCPGDRVDDRKQLRLLRAASQWLEEHPSLLQPRFDVIEVLLDPRTGDLDSVHWMQDAFGLEGRKL